jgi:hypothetical protein
MPSHSYNSVIYTSVGVNNYYVFFVNQTFVEPRQANLSSPELLGLMGFHDNSDKNEDLTSILGHLQESTLAGTLDKLDNEKCIQYYGKMYLSDRRNLLLVRSVFKYPEAPAVNFELITNEVIDSFPGCAVDPVPWMCVPNGSYGTTGCETPCVNRVDELLAESQNWRVSITIDSNLERKDMETIYRQVDYCLSQPVDESCKLQFSLPIAIIVILLNISKAAIMLILAFGLQEARVQTMGDAIASFLIQPDHILSGRCLYTASNFKQAGLSGHPHDLIFTEKRRWFAEADAGHMKIPTYIL